MTPKRILLNIPREHKEYAKSALERRQARATFEVYDAPRLMHYAASIHADVIVCAHPATFNMLLAAHSPGTKKRERPSLDNYRGSTIWFEGSDIPVVLTLPLNRWMTSNTEHWIIRKDFEKACALTTADRFTWTTAPYTLLTSASHINDWFKDMVRDAPLIALDIETTKVNSISCIGISTGNHTAVIPMFPDELVMPEAAYASLRTLLMHNTTPVVCHNGTFDLYQMIRWNLPVRNYRWDTEYCMNAWQPELPKSLAFCSSVMLKDHWYWKDDPWQYGDALWSYNATDVQRTIRVALWQMRNVPDWGQRQMAKKVRRVPPAITCSLRGMRLNQAKFAEEQVRATKEVADLRARLDTLTGHIGYKPTSPPHRAWLFYDILSAPPMKRQKKGKKMPRSTDATALQYISAHNPLVERLAVTQLQFNLATKALSSYWNAHMLNGRCGYAYRVDGTTTDRFSSNQLPLFTPNSSGLRKDEGHYGVNIQGAPKYFKHCLVPDPGFIIGEIDAKQADARGAAHISRDPIFISAIEDPASLYPAGYIPTGDETKDFYCLLADRCYGKKITKKDKMRQLTKIQTHGSSYIMGGATLMFTVVQREGPGAPHEYMRLVGKVNLSPENFFKYVLANHTKLFKGLRRWWDETLKKIQRGEDIITPDGWVRPVLCPTPGHAKAQLRNLVGHQPQHLSCVAINNAFERGFYELELPSQGEFRLLGQIHDSVVFQAVEGRFHEYMARMLEFTHNEYTVQADGHTFSIPHEPKWAPGGGSWADTVDWTPPAESPAGNSSEPPSRFLQTLCAAQAGHRDIQVL